MGGVKFIQNSFNGGILSPTALARVDLAKYYTCVKDALNCNAHPHGGLYKRTGFKYIATLAGDGRLVRFAFNVNQAYLLAFTALNVAIYKDDVFVQNVVTTYTVAQLKVMGYAQSADTMIITHEDHIPRALVRDSGTGTWSISDITLTGASFPQYDYPENFTNDGSTQVVTVEIGETVFDEAGSGNYYKAVTQRVSIDLSTETYTTIGNWTDLGTSGNEDVISATRGWAKTCTFYESRLWFGGLKGRPQTILGSVSSDFYNFNLGTSLADEAIYDTLDTDQINPIVSIFPGNKLLVFTEGGEFSNSAKPIKPDDSAWTRHTNYGSSNTIRPELLDGATLYVDATGRNLREFVFTFAEDSYTSTSASTLAYDIINAPVDATLIRGTSIDISNLVILINDDGSAAVFNTMRTEEVAGWTRWETDGLFKSIESVYDDLYAIVSRDNGFFLERQNIDVYSDAHIEVSAGGPVITGLAHLEGQTVQIIADGSVMLDQVVSGGQVTTERTFTTAQVGLGYNGVIEMLPVAPNTGGGNNVNDVKRVLKTTLRIYETLNMKVNGNIVPFRTFGTGILDTTPAPFTGIKEFRHLGFGRLEGFTVSSETATPFRLLSAESKVKTSS